MDRIFIRDLAANGIIGVYDHEREQPQNIIINVVLFVDLHIAGKTDRVEDSVNYHRLAIKLQKHAESARRFTVEALAEDLAELCLNEAGVQKVQIRVEKPEAIPFCRSVGVEVERSREK